MSLKHPLIFEFHLILFYRGKTNLALLRLFRYLGKYNKYSFIARLFIALEVIMDILIPFMMSKIVDVGIATQDIGYITRMVLLMVGAAVLAMIFGVLGSRFATMSSTGFAMNLRQALFSKVQDYSFYNAHNSADD